MITSQDPLPIYGFILAGCLVLVILLNSSLGQFLAGWRRPEMGNATVRRRSNTTLRCSIFNGGGDGDGDDKNTDADPGAVLDPDLHRRSRIKFRSDESGNRRYNHSPDDRSIAQTNARFIFDDDPDGVDEKEQDISDARSERFGPDIASRSSSYYSDDESLIKNRTTPKKKNGITTGGGDGRSRYAVLREWSF